MIWRIFRKDCGQLWLFIASVAMVQLLAAALWFALGPLREPRGLVIFAEVFSYAGLFGMLALIAAAVQQDVVPGVSQDWLVRPFHRSDLLWAKLLFVLIAVQGPALLADFAHAMAEGFGLRDSLTATLSRGTFLLLVFELPVLALAAMTRTLVQVTVGMLAIWFFVVAGVFVGILIRGGGAPALAGSGLQWMTPAFWSVLAFSAAAVTIPLQYFRRATTRSHQIVMGVVLLSPLLSYWSWESAFSFQSWLSPNPAAAEPIVISFDPGLGKSAAEPAATSANTVLMPIHVAGMAPESIIMNDRSEIRLIDSDGTTLFRGRTTANLGYGDDFPVRTSAGGDVHVYQRIVFPEKIYKQISTRTIKVEINYFLTLFQVESANSLAAIDGEGRFAALGWCRTKIDPDGDDAEFGCIKTGSAPMCVSVTLANPVTGNRNPEHPFCNPDYPPYAVHLYPDAMSQLGGDIAFRDLQGLAKYPVDSSQLAVAQVSLKSWRPQAHFTRHLVIPAIRLGDWAANSADSTH